MGDAVGTIGSVFPGPRWLRYGNHLRPEDRVIGKRDPCVTASDGHRATTHEVRRVRLDYPTIRLSDYPIVDITAERRIGRRDRRGEKRGDRRQRRVVAVTGGAGYIG